MATALLNLKTAGFFQVNNQELPTGEGPRAIPLLLDFTSNNQYNIDLSQLEQQVKFSMLQTVWIDASGTDQPVTVKVRGTNQTVQIKGRTQGFYPVLVPNPSFLEVSCADGALRLPLTLINVPIMGVQWPTQ